MSAKTLTLGAEYDDALRSALGDTIRDLGGHVPDGAWTLAGSQELTTAVAIIDGRRIAIEVETYVGLSITGDADLVDRIHDLVAARHHGAH